MNPGRGPRRMPTGVHPRGAPVLLKGNMTDKRIKPQRHLYLHRPPRRDKQDAWRCFGLAFSLFLVVVAIRLIAGLFN